VTEYDLVLKLSQYCSKLLNFANLDDDYRNQICDVLDEASDWLLVHAHEKKQTAQPS